MRHSQHRRTPETPALPVDGLDDGLAVAYRLAKAPEARRLLSPLLEHVRRAYAAACSSARALMLSSI